MVPTSSIVFMAVAGLMAAALAVVPAIVIWRRYKPSILSFFIGAGTFFVFAMVLESLMHAVVLRSSIGETIQASTWLFALYGGLAAGIFEETGRLVSMSFLMKKQHDRPANALMYGAGHGGCEALLIVGVTQIVNISLAVALNTGQLATMEESLPADQREALTPVIEQLTTTAPHLFLLSGFERITAVILHLSFSVLVWAAVTHRMPLLYILAIILHAGVDGLLVVLQRGGMDMVLLEVILFVLAVGCAAIAWIVWKRCLDPAPAPEQE